MGRATFLIKQMGGSKYDIYHSTLSIDANSGADIVSYAYNQTVLGYIQPTATHDGKKGVALLDNESGDEIIASYYIYHDTPLNNHDRLQYNGFWYEIRAIEDWNSSFMKFWKSYLVEVENQ